MTTGLVLEEVSHAYGAVPAVRGLSLRVGPGEVVALLGPSGCGKSTVLRLAAGLETLQHGRIRIDGVTVAEPGRSVPPERRSVGLMFQDFALFPHLTVAENVAFGLLGTDARRRREVARAALERVGMTGFADAYPHTLSGGEQQRVALARALAPRPKVMLLDEPFSGLDVVLRDRVRQTTAEVLREARTPALIVTHDPEEAMLVADRIALMRAGQILQEGAPDTLYRHPETAFCATFLGEANRFTATVAGGRAATPLGLVKAPGYADGTAVTVLVRPEAVAIARSVGRPAVVEEVRSLGRSGLVTLRLDCGPAVQARVAWSGLPKDGQRVGVSVQPTMVFVFPAADS